MVVACIVLVLDVWVAFRKAECMFCWSRSIYELTSLGFVILVVMGKELQIFVIGSSLCVENFYDVFGCGLLLFLGCWLGTCPG